jgi:hypothetical protein
VLPNKAANRALSRTVCLMSVVFAVPLLLLLLALLLLLLAVLDASAMGVLRKL